MTGMVERALLRRHGSSLLRFALACLVASCAAERRNSAAETEIGARQQPPTEAASPPSPDPAKSPAEPALKVTNISRGRFVLEAYAPTKVASDGALERRSDDGSWISVPFRLRRECAPVAASGESKCLVILPGQPFVGLSWNGADCGPCCHADEPVPLMPGEYRLAPRACEGAQGRWEGPSFDVPESSYVLERLRAAANIEKASVFQLAAPGPRDARDEGTIDPSMIIGRPIVAGSEATLSPELVSQLGKWLGNPTGFNNFFTRRCLGGERYGFRLTRNVPHVGREVTELAVELRCNSIAIANEEGTLRPRVYSYFDESRPELLALLRQAVLPALREGIPKR